MAEPSRVKFPSLAEMSTDDLVRLARIYIETGTLLEKDKDFLKAIQQELKIRRQTDESH